MISFKSLISSLVLLTISGVNANAQLKVYPPISAISNGKTNGYSPDPMISYLWPSPKASDGLEQYELQPIGFYTAEHNSFDLKNKKGIEIKGKGTLRFDFGRVSAGWLEFESEDLQDSITMSISEYNEPAVVNKGALNPVKTKTPLKHGYTYRLELNPELYEGVRFGWLDVKTHQHDWHMKNLRLVCQVKPVNYQGSFSCSDSTLTKIWYTGAYTVKLNLQQDYFGAILMERSDRHSWTGDAYPSQAASMVAFGNYDFVKNNLINTSGLNNGIASYSLYWVLSLIDYVNYTGDADFARKYAGNACSKLDTAFSHFGKTPSLGFYGWDERLGAGFENPNIAESQYAYSMLSIRAWSEFAHLMEQIGNPVLAAKYQNYAGIKLSEIREKNTWTASFGLHAAADAINTGLTTKAEKNLFYHKNFEDRINRLSYSPFNQFFVLNAMSTTGHYDDALNMVRDYWGGQIAQGGTTFYEDYRPSWNAAIGINGAPPNNQCGYTSLTHPWSTGVVKWLSEEVLGIKPLQPGFKTFQIKPHLGASLKWASGSVYTKNGLIAVATNIGSGITRITIPRGTTAQQIAIPLAGTDIWSILMNGKPVYSKNKAFSAAGVQLANNCLNIHQLEAGNYTIRVNYTKKTFPKAKIDAPWNYPISKFTQDSVTAGKWLKTYGKDGYILFNAKKSGENLQQLPNYIKTVSLKNQANRYLTVVMDDAKLLTDPSGKPQNFGAVITKDPDPTQQTITIDLDVNDEQSHQISLYFLDWEKHNRRSAIEIFDLKTLKIFSPLQLVQNYTNGKYFSFNYSGSIRIRIDQVRGENVAISGLFFDQSKN
ncbi:alpha-L-rhamnosidase C-terminal domain-containing protein [Pedobacter sp. L105]|uniref:alpha-L-rhamnosidase C-terminal domain-containing protein n=1 Tax=Pedobacter sp. L105 TaxID=1641871 RepID=UPI00131AD7C5|nr:alpha-L-rhamnosidase C-terminal domain-containing protein [Pedobacter sp. L105]